MTKYIHSQNYLEYTNKFSSIQGYYSGTSLENIVSEIHKKLFGTQFTNLPLELGGKLL